MAESMHDILKRYWGFDQFRPLQEEIIRSALKGQDTLALLPTGSGKSVCFQVPALLLPGICIVVSPLIALMKDQVSQLRKKGISALALHTGMAYKEMIKTLELAVNSKIKFLYLSPERLQTRVFRDYLAEMPVSLIAIDEAHCVSQWGYDFRPSYLQIKTLREALPDVPVLALTASATPLVQTDIISQLELRTANILKGSFSRDNLSYSCFEEDNKLQKLVTIFSQVEGSGIVYCRSRKRTVEISKHLQEKGFTTGYYHAGLDQETRHERQQEWTGNKSRIMVSTNAFGMGIDKPDVRVVVHYDVPDCLENYYQEAGRAGRDRQKAYAVLLYNQQELTELEVQAEKKYPSLETIRKVYQSVASFLQIPSGAGEGLTYDFDLTLFCQNFQIDRPTAINALQILQAEGYYALNESVFVPSTVQFLANREWVESFEQLYPHHEPLLKALLRKYEGIYSYPAMISENYLAKHCRSDREAITKDLHFLAQQGLIEYTPKKDHPQLVLLTDRVKTEYVQIDVKALEKRKSLAKERLQALNKYITQSTCRSTYIGRYFGDAAIKDCGICDNCLRQKKSGPSTSQLLQLIPTLLAQSPQTIQDLQRQLPTNTDNTTLWSAINHLLAEARITQTPDSRFHLL